MNKFIVSIALIVGLSGSCLAGGFGFIVRDDMGRAMKLVNEDNDIFYFQRADRKTPEAPYSNRFGKYELYVIARDVETGKQYKVTDIDDKIRLEELPEEL